LANPQVQAMGYMSVLDTPNGPLATAGPQWRLSRTEARITRPSPALGEHQGEVLRELAAWTPSPRTAAPRAAEVAMRLALDGLRVIDVSQGVSGPLCAMQLGDLGADVVKLEPPAGDWLRTVGPFQ